mmetsp:Transcript_24533/g.24772  ORF Transcript_24533/g.24772 Transcript_24533/m.24772 type:complete len:195 (-) Transcript_24533:28-612(-)
MLNFAFGRPVQKIISYQFSTAYDSLIAISGFSQYASRRDVLEVIDEDIPIVSIDAIMNRFAYPSGKWVVQVNSDDRSKLESKFKGFKDLKLTFSTISPNQLRYLGRTANQIGITDSTVRLRNLPNTIGEEEIRFFFQDYALRKKPFEIKNTRGEYYDDYEFIHFNSPHESLRAVIQKNNQVILGRNISLVPYLI